MRYRSDPRKVVHETIDGEVILIQLETGNYYSLGGSGSRIWALLQEGVAPDGIAERLRASFDAPTGQVEEAVERLTAELVGEGLLEQDGDWLPASRGPVDDPAGRTPFAEPSLEKYTDMQDFLLVDPIHEVSDAGWPHTQPSG
jgi:coenzyme PQQ synthesis protein D (PqqD)